MELLFVALGGAIIGLIAHFSLPGTIRRGVIVLPALATVVISVAWEALTWAGLSYGNFLIWGISFGLAIIVAFVFGILQERRRAASDEAFFDVYSKTGRVA